MYSLQPVLNDMVIILFNLLLFCSVFVMRKDNRVTRTMLYGGCAVIVSLYFWAVYVKQYPLSLAIIWTTALPSLVLFYILSEYKDSRFFLTFCLVDTVTLIIAVSGWYVNLKVPYGKWIALGVTLVLTISLHLAGKPYLVWYKQLLALKKGGWGAMATASALVYFTSLFLLAYPVPIIHRLEYMPVWFAYAATVLACYVVFILSIVKTKEILEKNHMLEHEKDIYRMAYTDSLTGLWNRAAFIERVNYLDRSREQWSRICCVMMDLDDFKYVNDTMGHRAGDRILQQFAAVLQEYFTICPEYVFRSGGDEFCVLIPELEEGEVQQLIHCVRRKFWDETCKMGRGMTVSIGSCYLKSEQFISVEDAFAEADSRMYEDKVCNKSVRGGRE